jgi:hypothetical protein
MIHNCVPTHKSAVILFERNYSLPHTVEIDGSVRAVCFSKPFGVLHHPPGRRLRITLNLIDEAGMVEDGSGPVAMVLDFPASRRDDGPPK